MQNKITVDDFKVIVKILKAAYPRDNFIPNNYTFGLWYKALQDIQYPTLNKAVTNYIMTNKFPPTIADIRSLSYRLTNRPDMLSSAAWNQLIRALRQSYSPDAETYWEQLPERTKLIVGGFATFRAWGNTSLESLESVQRPMFIKRWEEYQRREMTEVAIPAGLRTPQPALEETPRVQIEDKQERGNGVEAPADMIQALRERLNK